PASGVCELRTYGGCGGNANLFDTFEECATACKLSADPHTTCNEPTDCELRSPSCCGDCEPIAARSLIAVNHSAPSPICTVLCGACPPVAPNQSTSRYFIPGCVEHRCTVIDIRETTLTECAADDDCGLRNTAACCEGCGNSGDPIAYNRKLDPITAFCGGKPVPCPACVGGIPEGFISHCRAKRCLVEQLVR
ncbi:MAG TPA: BPTI/Kunitz domain-containing protein, partial [Polyangiaceae bacterium]|nr:BPTI/Kunitz domain-containing protein [Polyangiaceae bacterium]